MNVNAMDFGIRRHFSRFMIIDAKFHIFNSAFFITSKEAKKKYVFTTKSIIDLGK